MLRAALLFGINHTPCKLKYVYICTENSTPCPPFPPLAGAFAAVPSWARSLKDLENTSISLAAHLHAQHFCVTKVDRSRAVYANIHLFSALPAASEFFSA